MAKKKSLSEVQAQLDRWFPNSGYTISVYNGVNREGYLEDSTGRKYRFSSFSNLKKLGTLARLRTYLDDMYLAEVTSNRTSGQPTVHISVTGDQNTTLHNSELKSQTPNPNPTLERLLSQQRQLTALLTSPEVQAELPPTLRVTLDILLNELQTLQQNL